MVHKILISLSVFFSDKLNKTEVSHDFSIIVTMAGVDREAINKNRNMRAINFINVNINLINVKV
jgi:hypothetical protein